MARRNRDLAGLAALGALGYMMSRKQDGSNVPVTDYSTGVRPSVASAAAAPADIDPDLAREMARAGRGPIAVDRLRPAGPSRSMAAADTAEEMAPTAALPQEVPSRGRRELPPRRNVAGDYTRRMGATADEIAALSPRRNVAGDYTRGMGATADEIAAYRTREITPPPMTPEMRRQAEAQALEGVYPETMYGGPGLKGLHAAAKRLAAPRVAEYSQPLLAGPTARLTGPSKKDLVARDRAARAAGRQEEMLQENARRYGLDPSAPGYEGAARAVREGLGDGAFTLKKKGGMVKAKPKKMASGGSTGSASKRGDGIASRGKTKCKMY